jgi:hypothetical protein
MWPRLKILQKPLVPIKRDRAPKSAEATQRLKVTINAAIILC